LALLIRSLHLGGTERQLAELATRLDPARFSVNVLTFYDGGPIQDRLVAAGVPVISLHKRGRWDLLRFARNLHRALRRLRPDILYCFLVEPSVLGLLVGRAAGVPAILWGVRTASLDYSPYDRWTRLTFSCTTWLSRYPTLIVANSDAGRRHHIRAGYPATRTIAVPNGIDTTRYHPSPERRALAREGWGVRPDEVFIGLVGRLDAVKNPMLFLEAAARVASQQPAVRFVCVGSGPDAYAEALRTTAAALGLGAGLLWAGELQRMEDVYPALDVLCSASDTEGFSNVIGEAMACGVPCVVTDVGDSALIVGDTGLVVPPKDAAALAAALVDLTRRPGLERARLGLMARARVEQQFSVTSLLDRTATLLADVVRRPDAVQAPIE
jgi:glycosyltransferase involved in cell wall biosynthesis